MPYYTKYHVREQSARALLPPIAASLRELERRTRHYAQRLNLDPGADEALRAAGDALEKARIEVERLLAVEVGR
jgi:hypothetical protein